MSTTRPTLAATHREVTGKAVSHLRSSGQLPAVVFGNGVDSTNVSLDAHAFELLRRKTSANTLVNLSIDGKKSSPVLVHGVQLSVRTQKPIHADLFLVRMTEEMTVDVALVATGDSEAVKVHGGTLLHPISHVRVKALPDHLPQSLPYDISGLTSFDDVVHLRDVTIPADVTLLTDPDEIVARVAPPRVEEVVEVVGEALEGEAEAAADAVAPASGSGDSGGASADD